MTREGVTFLTKKDFDVKSLITILKEQSKLIEKNEDQKILKQILMLLEKNNLTLLSPQEIHFLESNKQETWAEYLIFRYKMNYFPKQKIVYDFPVYLLIEPVSACNLRCIMCFQIDETFTSNNKFMGMIDFELFKKIIDDAVAGGTKAITLASRGEPTLHPKLGEMLEYCSGKFFELKINTNATRLNEKLIHQILKTGVTTVVFSIDSYEKNEFEKIRVKGVFEQVLNNVKQFKEIKDTFYPDSRCETRVSGVKIDKNQDPVKFNNFWKKYVDNVVMVEMENRWDTYHNPKDIMASGPCNYLWERMYIWHDGTCNPCDVDYKSELSIGSVKEKSIKEIWNGKKFQQLRESHLNGKRTTLYPCDRCPIDV
mgnify:CR=1 FL=1